MKVKKNKRPLKVFIAISVIILLLIGGLYVANYFFKDNFFARLASINEQLSGNVESSIDVLHYDLAIRIDNKNKLIHGTASVLINPLDSSNVLSLDFYNNFEVESVQLNNDKVEYKFDGNRIVIQNQFAFEDSSRIKIVYSGTPQRKGLGSFNFGEYNGKPYVYSLNEPVFASSWFPCNDIPNDKATLEMSITNDSSLVSISNGQLTGIETNDSLKTYRYKTDYPISTYLIALYSGDYRTFNDFYTSPVSNDSVEIRYYVTPDKINAAKIDFSVHPKVLEVFSNLFGEYPFKDDGYGVAQFWWNAGAMEHQTITGISSNFITGNKFHTNFLVHELAHHWWGNAVGPETWRDIWLNEGFATYSEALYWEATTGKKSLISTMNGFRKEFNQSTLFDPGVYMFSRLVYEKGAWVLHMLRHKLGDEIFFRILRNYFEKYKYKSAETFDFIEVCEDVSSRKLDWFFEQWVYDGEGVIKLEYNWQLKDDLVLLYIKQSQSGYDNYRFLLDVSTTLTDSSVIKYEFNFSSRDTLLEIPGLNVVSVDLDPDCWLLADILNTNDEKQ